MPRPAWVDTLPPDQFLLVKDRRLLLALYPDRRERALERAALTCWGLGLERLGDHLDERRCARQWERARREVGCSG